MAEERSIIYNVEIDSGTLTQQAAQLTTEITRLKEEQKALAVAGKANTVEFQNNATQLRSLQREYKNTTTQLDNNVRATKAADGSYEELYNTTKLLEVQLKTLPNAFDKNNKEAQALTAQINLNKTALLGLNATIQDGRLNVGNYGNTVNGLKKRYAELQERVAGLDIGSKEFKQAQTEIIKTRDALGLAQGKFDEFGESIKKGNAKILSTFTDVGEGAVAAFAIAPLLNENLKAEELQANALKAIAIAQNTVALAKGIANVKDAAGIVISKGAAAATFLQAGAIKAAGLAQSIFSKGVLTSSVSLRIFKGALISTGIGAIIVLIGELINNWDDITSAVGRFIGISKEASEKTAEDYENMSAQAKTASENFKKQIDINIALIKDERKRRLEEIKEAARRELQEENLTAATKAAINRKLNADLSAANDDFDKKDKEKRDKAIKEAQDRFDKLFAIYNTNKERRIKTELDGVEQELALFDLNTTAQIREAKKRGEDVNALTALRTKERLAIIAKGNEQELEEEKKKFDAQQEINKKVFEADVANEQRKIRLEKDGVAEAAALFDLETGLLLTQAAERGEDLNLVEQERLLQRNEVIKQATEEELNIKREAAEQELAITEARSTATSNLLGAFISSLTVSESASKKNADFVKTLSASQATIQGLLAVQKALASAPPPLNFIEAAAVGITATANVAKILSAKPFARGGLTGKRIGSGDGLPIRRSNGDNILATVRTGEVILNERHQRALGGPRTFKSIGVPGFADGGFVNNQIQNEINATFNMNDFANVMKSVRPVVSVKDINTGQQRVQAIDDLTRL